MGVRNREREREGDRDRETDRQTWELETLRQKTDRQKDRQTGTDKHRKGNSK